jgi:hypothetical protein
VFFGGIFVFFGGKNGSGGLTWGQKGRLPPCFFFALFEKFFYFKIFRLFKNLH